MFTRADHSAWCKISKISKLSAAATLVALAFGTSPAKADVSGDNWLNFGSRTSGTSSGWGFGSWSSGWGGSSSRSYAKSWEANPRPGFPTLARDNLATLKAAIGRYERIVANGGWKQIPMTRMSRGSGGQSVALLRQRLTATGDLRARSRYYSGYDSTVEAAVKRFQIRHGLTPTGSVDKRTLYALNVPARERLHQLRTNLGRLTNLTRDLPKKFMVVNIPAAQIEAVESGRVVHRYTAVVGKVDRQSPELRSRVHEINFNPYWTVPRSIVYKDLVPKARAYARAGKDVLSAYRMNAYDAKGRRVDPRRINWRSKAVYNYTYRQDPWKENSMGFVKVNFHNKHSVFIHDTPSKNLFGRNFRAYSSGCIRVHNIGKLVTWLLGPNGDWSERRVARMKHTGQRSDVALRQPVPVYFAYVTGWATEDGVVHFRRDIYKRDGVGVMASAY